MSGTPGPGTDDRPAVILTGGAGRLGRAIAGELSGSGARVLLVDRDRDALEAMLPFPGQDSATVATLALDVAASEAPAAAFDGAMEAFGRVDAVINNAGLEGPIARVEDVAMADVRALLDINVLAVLAFCQEAIRRFRAQGRGRIVNMASGAGTAGTGLMAAYSASKHAVLGLTRSIAVEVAGVGIQVNAVCPGCVGSPMMERIEARIGEIEGTGPASFLSVIPAGRYCEPEEVARLVAWLALDAPDYINGTAQVIDGALRA